MKTIRILLSLLLLSTAVQARRFDPGAAGQEKIAITKRPQGRLPTDTFFLEKFEGSLGPEGFNRAAEWLIVHTRTGKYNPTQELNAYGNTVLRGLFEAPDRVNAQWKAKDGVFYQVESAQMGYGAVFKSGEFRGFTKNLVASEGMPGRSPLRDLMDVDINAKGPLSPLEANAYGDIIFETVTKDPKSRQFTIIDGEGRKFVQVESPDLNIAVRAGERNELVGFVRFAADREAGLSRDLQKSIINVLKDGEVVGVRSRVYEANFLDWKYPAKPAGAAEVARLDHGVRVLEDGSKVVSDLDLAFYTKNGAVFPESHSLDLGRRINAAYGHDVVMHGDNYWGVEKGVPKAIDIANRNERIFVFDRNGYVMSGGYREIINKFIGDSGGLKK